MSPSGDRRRPGIREAACHANATRTGAAGAGGRAHVAVGRPAEDGHSQGDLPSECHKDGSRGGSQGAEPPKKGPQRNNPVRPFVVLSIINHSTLLEPSLITTS